MSRVATNYIPKTKSQVFRELERLSAEFPLDKRNKIKSRGSLSRDHLVARNIQYGQILDPDANLHGLMTSETVDELHCLRRGIAVWWGSLAAGFKAYWTRLLSPAHRETILLAGFEAVWRSEHGHVYSKFLLDFQVSKLLANDGQPFLTFVENVLQRGFMDFDASIPSLDNELDQTISDWIGELKEENEYDKYKGDYLVYLKVLIHFSQAIFVLRFLSQVMELWSVIATNKPIEPPPAQVYQENSVKTKNSSGSTSNATTTSAVQNEAKKISKKKSNKRRGKNAKARGEARNKEAKTKKPDMASAVATSDELNQAVNVVVPSDPMESTLSDSTEAATGEDAHGYSEITTPSSEVWKLVQMVTDGKADVTINDLQDPDSVDVKVNDGYACAMTMIAGLTMDKTPAAANQRFDSGTPDRSLTDGATQIPMSEPYELVYDERSDLILLHNAVQKRCSDGMGSGSSISGDISTTEERSGLKTRDHGAYKPRNAPQENLQLEKWRSQYPEASITTDKEKEDVATKLQACREVAEAKIPDTRWVHTSMRDWFARTNWSSSPDLPEVLGKTPKITDAIAKSAAPVPDTFKRHNPLRQLNAGLKGLNFESLEDSVEQYPGLRDNVVLEEHNLSHPEYEDLMAIPGSSPIFSSSSSSRSSSGSESRASVYVDAKLISDAAKRSLEVPDADEIIKLDDNTMDTVAEENGKVPDITGAMEDNKVDETVGIIKNSDLTVTDIVQNIAHPVDSDGIAKVVMTQTSAPGEAVEAAGVKDGSALHENSVETDIEMLQTLLLGYALDSSDLVDEQLPLLEDVLIPKTAILKVRDLGPRHPSKVYVAVPDVFRNMQSKPNVVQFPAPDAQRAGKSGKSKKPPLRLLRRNNRANKEHPSAQPPVQGDTTGPSGKPQPPHITAETERTLKDTPETPILTEIQFVHEGHSHVSLPGLGKEHICTAGVDVSSLAAMKELATAAVCSLSSTEKSAGNGVSDIAVLTQEKLLIGQSGSEISLPKSEKESDTPADPDGYLLVSEQFLADVEVRFETLGAVEEPKSNPPGSRGELLTPSKLDVPSITFEEYNALTVSTEKHDTGPTISAQGFYIENPNAMGQGLLEGPGFADRVRALLERSSPSSSMDPSRQGGRGKGNYEVCLANSARYGLGGSLRGQYAQLGGNRGGRGGRHGQYRQRNRASRNRDFFQVPNGQMLHRGPANLPPHQVGQSSSPSQEFGQHTATPPGLTHPRLTDVLGLGIPPYQSQAAVSPWYDGMKDIVEHKGTAYHRSEDSLTGYFGFPKIPLELLPTVKDARLGALKFECCHCQAPLTHEDSVICLICGVNSAIRFCDDRCRYAAGGHWQFCGLDRLPYRTDYDSTAYRYLGPLRTTGSPNPYIYWQTTVLHDFPGFDYVIFDRGFLRNLPPYILKAVIFPSQTLRNRFHAILKRAVWDYDQPSVLLLFRVVRFWAREHEWVLPEGLLEDQFEMEFGGTFTGFRNAHFPDSMPSEAEWREYERHLGELLRRDGFPGWMTAINTKLPLVREEPKVPGYLLDRMNGAAAPALDV